jgi:hypothetical protein
MGYLSAMIPPASPHVELRVALKSILGFWAFYFTVNTLHMLFAGNPHQLEMVVRRTGVVLVGILITLAMYAVLRRWNTNPCRSWSGRFSWSRSPAPGPMRWSISRLSIWRSPMTR